VPHQFYILLLLEGSNLFLAIMIFGSYPSVAQVYLGNGLKEDKNSPHN